MKNDSPIMIALIDDHAKLRNAVANYLESFNYTVILQAADGKEGLEAIALLPEKPKLCIVDINMPVMDGFATARQLTQSYPTVKILAFSVHGDEENVVKMVAAGAKGYLQKGCDPEEIKRAADQLVAGKYYFSEAVKDVAIKYLFSEGKLLQ
ncbi:MULTISPECIES: response regulator transcription factor [Flavobacterium]|jgi:DNA-binding NarL/FixJ family response regulator|uniref:response regulator n=1 Tax=Flavobacterium TaxID=237 RepID=UPI000C3A4164|nr:MULTISPECIES: response regulator transcription factor [Flavobacterium]MBF00240.1 response regulator [Flavobacterium sp.]MBY8963126.1 response regulator transcription factor [Flavobacterium coralii]MCR5863536.1 response regulator transcription factor [Flavobacterium sp. J372]|tara:strand:- start:51446 stop:51901 length:456 start_codon:yes stop_codon:yes gene_type:complete